MPDPGKMEAWWPLPPVSLRTWSTSGLWSQAEPSRQQRFKKGSVKDTLQGSLDLTPVQQWDPSLFRLQRWDSSPSQGGWRESRRNCFSVLSFHVMPVLSWSPAALLLSVWPPSSGVTCPWGISRLFFFGGVVSHRRWSQSVEHQALLDYLISDTVFCVYEEVRKEGDNPCAWPLRDIGICVYEKGRQAGRPEGPKWIILVNGNPLQYSCLKDPMDRGAWQVHGIARVRHDLLMMNYRYRFLYLC